MFLYEDIYEEASAVHLGAAIAQGKGALILESTLHPAKEYLASFRPCPEEEEKGQLSHALKEYMKKEQLILGSCMHPYGAGPLLLSKVQEAGADMRFLSQVLSVEKIQNGFCVHTFCMDRKEDFFCRRFHPKKKTEKRCYHALIRKTEDFLLPEFCDIFPTVKKDLFILRLPLSEGENLLSIHQRIRRLPGICPVHLPDLCCEYHENDPGLFSALEQGKESLSLSSPERKAAAEVPALSCDVLVAGGGTAGALAALRAAKSGMQVIVLDRLAYPGGMHTGAVFGYYLGAKGGLYEEIDARAMEIQREMGIESDRMGRLSKLFALEEALDKAGVLFLGNAALTEVITKERSVSGVRCLLEGKPLQIACRFLIDGTSDGFAVHMAHCQTETGRAFDGRTQPFSYTLLFCPEKGTDASFTNTDFGYVDAGDMEKISRAILESAGKVRSVPGLPLGETSLLGIREGRHIIGENCVRWPDFIAGKPAEKPVTFSLSNLDDHGKDIAFESPAHADWLAGMSMWGAVVRLDIPLGALIPREYDNLCVAGRHLSMDHDCAAQLRMNRDMQRIGEAAGEIAALAVLHDCPAMEIPYEKLMGALSSSNCWQEKGETDVWDDRRGDDRIAQSYPRNDEEMLSLLSGDQPGLAMLYALREKKQEKMHALLSSENSWTAFNAAAVLALSGDASGKDILLSALKNRDRTLLRTGRKFNMTKGLAALYLLGRLSLASCEQAFLDVWEEDQGLFSYAPPSDEFFCRPEDTRFAYMSHAARALLQLCKDHPQRRESILALLEKKTEDPHFQIVYSLKGSENLLFDATETLRRFVRQGKRG